MEYTTIPKLAIGANCSDKAIRRYKERFPDFFNPTIIDGIKNYPYKRTLEMIKHIRTLYQDNLNRKQIKKILETEYTDLYVPVKNQLVDNIPKTGAQKMTTINLKELKSIIKEALMEFTDILSNTYKKNDEQTQKLQDLEQKVNEQSAAIDELHEIIKAIKIPEKKPQIRAISDYKLQIIKKINELKDSGLTLTKIAEKFNKEKVKTLSGTGKWNPGTLSKLWRNFD